MQRKMTRLPSASHFKEVQAPLQAIPADLFGPILPPTNAGARYFLTIVDQYSGHIHVNILIHKNDAIEAITKYKANVENQTNLTIKKLISDGGGEFVNGELGEMLTTAGIKHVVAPLYTPQHNGYAERANCTVIEMMRTMMMQANLAPEWGGEAVQTAAATTNCLPSLGKAKVTVGIYKGLIVSY
jgi:hypothetical protein